MSEHLLTKQERERFARYCREEAESYGLLLEQIGKLGSSPAMDILKQNHKQLVEAYAIVAVHLTGVVDD